MKQYLSQTLYEMHALYYLITTKYIFSCVCFLFVRKHYSKDNDKLHHLNISLTSPFRPLLFYELGNFEVSSYICVIRYKI